MRLLAWILKPGSTPLACVIFLILTFLNPPLLHLKKNGDNEDPFIGVLSPVSELIDEK